MTAKQTIRSLEEEFNTLDDALADVEDMSSDEKPPKRDIDKAWRLWSEMKKKIKQGFKFAIYNIEDPAIGDKPFKYSR